MRSSGTPSTRGRVAFEEIRATRVVTIAATQSVTSLLSKPARFAFAARNSGRFRRVVGVTIFRCVRCAQLLFQISALAPDSND